MKTSSAKAKGRRAAQEFKDMLLVYAPSLQDDDIIVTSSGETGEDLKLSPAARAIYPVTIEMKNVEKLNVRAAYAQACGHTKGYVPLLAHTKNRAEMLITLKARDFLELYFRSQS